MLNKFAVRLLPLLCLVFCLATQAAAPAANSANPTFVDVKYGQYQRNALDFWKAKSDRPTPVVVIIHGGGFLGGDKTQMRNDPAVQICLGAGVSCAAINYRYRNTAPMQDVLRDCARAIQFLRSKANEWNIDKTRIAAYGNSAGAGTSLWLAFHDDFADPKNADPVLRESSRLACAGGLACQFSYDFFEWKTAFKEEESKGFGEPESLWPASYGLGSMAELLGPAGQKIRHDCDIRGLISKDDPPVFLYSGTRGGKITSQDHLYHHPKHAELIKKRCDEIGIDCVATIPAFNIKPAPAQARDLREFLFQHLGVKTAGQRQVN